MDKHYQLVICLSTNAIIKSELYPEESLSLMNKMITNFFQAKATSLVFVTENKSKMFINHEHTVYINIVEVQ